MNARRVAESVMTSALLVFGTFAGSALATKLFGVYCWPTRFGGLLVGIAVLAQGIVYANREYFSKRSKYNLTREQRVLHQVYVITVFGTLLWAMGDFLPPFFGVVMCRAP